MTMAGKKMWRDAATLILTAKSPVGKNLPQFSGDLSAPAVCSNRFDYKVLMLKRSSKSKFMPNAYVFPGGVISHADFAKGWTDLFRDFGYNDDDLEQLVLKDVDRPMLMKADLDESISRDIALRYTLFQKSSFPKFILYLID